MNWHPPSRLTPLAAAGFALALAAGACTSAGASVSPSPAMIESPSPAMMESPSPAPVAIGTFHAVDGTATGTVALFHKPDGTFLVTFESFSIASAAHTDVILVPNKDVKSDSDIKKASIVDLGPLKGTSGMQDFAVPASADAMTYHAVVLWDTQMAHATAAAPLQ